MSAERKQVHVRMGKQFAPAETAGGEQRKFVRLTDARAPRVHDDAFDRLRARVHQFGCRCARVKCFGELAVGIAEQLAQCQSRFAGYAAARNRGGQARQCECERSRRSVQWKVTLPWAKE